MFRLVIISFFCVFYTIQAEAQIFNGIMNEAKRKLEKKIEDKIIEAVSDELAARAFKPIEASIDSLLRREYEESGSRSSGVNYADFIESLNKEVDLPEKYTFNLIQDVEITDYDGKKNFIKLYYSKSESILGFENVDDKHQTQTVVMDIERDAMVMFTVDKKGKKSGQVVPNVLKLSQSLVNNSANKAETDEGSNIKIKKTGKTKKIAGYKTDQYMGESEDEKLTFYLANNFPVYPEATMQAFIGNLAPAAYKENSNRLKNINLIMLEYVNERKKDNGETTSWITKKVSEKKIDFVNKDFGL